MRSLVLLLLCFGVWGCGTSNSGADPYQGVIDGTVLDTNFLAGKCSGRPCYSTQTGYVHGAAFNFFNLGTVQTSVLGTVKASTLPAAYTISDCIAPSEYDIVNDAYSSDAQFPVLSTLPLPVKLATIPALPFYKVFDAAADSPVNCNDVKDVESIVPLDGVSLGKFGLQPSDKFTVHLWAVIDPTAAINVPNGMAPAVRHYGWYKNLLAAVFDGGLVPLTTKGELVPMEGVILDPTTPTTAFAKTTDQKAILLPFKPGQAGYSPMVRLHSFRLPAGKSLGDYTGICVTGMDCGPQEVDFTKASSSAFNTVFISAL